MAKPRLTVELLFDTAAHAETVRAAIQAQVDARPRFEDRTELLVVLPGDDGRPVLRLDVRLLARGDRDALRDWLVGEVRDHPTVKTWVLGARVTEHLCTYDDASPGPCSASEFRVVFERGEAVS